MVFKNWSVFFLLTVVVAQGCDGAAFNVSSQIGQTSSSVKQVASEAFQILTNLQKLVQGPLKNALATLQLAGKTIKTLSQKNATTATTSGKQMINNTLQSIQKLTTNIRNQAMGKGTDLSVCYNSTTANLVGLVASFVANLTVCALNQANKGLDMINTDIAYISNIANITTALPVSINSCMSAGNKSLVYKCLKSLVITTSTTLVTAPVTVTNMVNNAYSFVNLFPTTLGVCATNTTFDAAVTGAALGLEVTSCIAEKIIGL